MKRIVYAVLALLLSSLAAVGQVPYFPQSLPAGTVIGRMPTAGAGPTEAIPISSFGPLLSPFNGTFAINPVPLSSSQGFVISQTASGFLSSGISTPIADNIYGLNLIQVTSDNVARPTGGTNKFGAFAIVHDYGGTSLIGGRNTLDISSIFTATSSVSNNDRNYQASNFEWFSAASDGGTNTGAGALGAGFSVGGAAILASGATNWANLSFMEVNVAVTTGASVNYKSGIQIASLPQDAVQGAVTDCALCVSAQTGSIGWKNGILFTNANGQGGINANGALIATTGSLSVTTGIDISSYSYSGSALHTPGFTVNNVGVITGDSIIATGISGAPVFASPGGFSISSGGVLSASTAVLPFINGGNGAASALILRSTTGVGSTDAIVMQTGNNGATEAVRILDSGQVKFTGSANFSANGSVATALTSVGPTGSHAAVQTWLTIQDNTGTVRYIPCF